MIILVRQQDLQKTEKESAEGKVVVWVKPPHVVTKVKKVELVIVKKEVLKVVNNHLQDVCQKLGLRLVLRNLT
ncbi:hypothetical protein D1872_282910 [compost metagenome]